ncbi:MAG: insulinase family protein [Candidatus Delongbacteria bacterium]
MRRYVILGVLGALAPAAFGLLPALPNNASLHRLDNGLEVLLLQIPDAPMVGMNVQVKTGSARESFRTSGMSHMLEHLLFNGTTQLDQAAFYAATDRIGAYNNANTNRHFTNYMMLVPTAELATGMNLQSQMLFSSTLPPEKFQKERGIVLEELAQDADSPEGRDEALWEDFLFAGSCFALPTLGTPATIRHLERDRVWDYYRSWYVPNNMLLSVVGGFDPATVLDEVERWYGQAAPGELPVQELKPLQWQPGALRLRHSARATRSLRLAWPAPDQGDPDQLAAGLLAWAAGDPRDGVLSALLFSEGLPPLEGLSLTHYDDLGFGRFELSADLPAGLDAEEAIAGLTRALVRLKDYPFPAETIALRLLDERASLAQLMEKPHYFGLMQAASFVQQGFEPVLTRGARLAALSPADLQACAARWLDGRPPMALVLEPVGEQGTATQSVADRLRQPAALDTPALLLEGGRPGEIFALQVVVRGRAVWEGESAAGGLNLIHRLLPEGAAGQSAAELSARLRRVGGKLTLADNPAIPYDDHYTSPSHTFLRLECLAEHWQSACSLAVDLLLKPDFPAEAFERERADLLERLDNQDGSARARSRQLLDSLLLAGLPAALPPEGRAGAVAALTLEDLRHLHALAFRPENLILAVVGPPPAAHVAECLTGLLAPFSSAPAPADLDWLRAHSPWLAPAAGERPLVPGRRVPEPVRQPVSLTETLGGEMSALRLGTRVVVDPADQPALRLLFAVLSDRISFDLREERGWAYSIGCWAGGSGERATLEAYMGTRPENLEPALKALREYLAGQGKPITQTELDKVRGGMLGRELMRGLASINQAWQLATGELAGQADQARQEEEALRRVTPADLARLSQTYLRNTPWITVQVQ